MIKISRILFLVLMLSPFFNEKLYAQETQSGDVKYYTNVEQLKNLEEPLINSSTAMVLGYYNPGDGGGGMFYWDLSSQEQDDNGSIIKATAIQNGRWKRIIQNETYNVKFFGAKGDGTTDDTIAVKATILAIENLDSGIAGDSSGAYLFFPRGTYILSETLVIKRTMKIGGTIGSNWGPTATLKWIVPGITGFYVHEPVSASSSDRGDGTIIENLSISGSDPTFYKVWTDFEMDDPFYEQDGHGIDVRAPQVRLKNLIITYFKYDAIHGVGFFNYENANNMMVEDIFIYGVGRHGVYMAGGNASAGLFTRVTGTSGIGGYTIYDRSFFGNTYLACTSEGAAHSYYTTTNPINSSTFLGSYQEASDGPAAFNGNPVVVGGTWGNGINGNPLLVGQVVPNGYGVLGGFNMQPPKPPFKKLVRGTSLGFTSFEQWVLRSGIDHVVLVDVSNGYGLIILENPEQIPKITYTIKRTDSAGSYLRIQVLGGKHIENSDVLDIGPGQSYVLQSDGSKYWIVSKF